MISSWLLRKYLRFQGQILAKTIYFSLDPTNRIWMSDIDQYMEPVEIGDIMRAGGSLAVVEESKAPLIKAGDIVQGGNAWRLARVLYNSWRRGCCYSNGRIYTFDSAHFCLGFTGQQLILVFLILVNQEGETVVVSAAAGAVGSIVCPISQNQGLPRSSYCG